MKVLAINASPNKGRGNTALILNPFLDGMKTAGAEVELVYTNDLDIKFCRGCLNCLYSRDGKCPQNDDMQKLYPKLREADIWVFGSPVHADGVTGPLMNLMSRTVSFLYPNMEVRNNRCRYPLRAGVKSGKVVLVSNSGFWEIEHFNPLVEHIKSYCANVSREFVGALLRPHGPALSGLIKFNWPVFSSVLYKDVLEAAKKAGYQLMKEGKISPKVLEKISRSLLPRAAYVAIANRDFKKRLEKSNPKLKK